MTNVNPAFQGTKFDQENVHIEQICLVYETHALKSTQMSYVAGLLAPMLVLAMYDLALLGWDSSTWYVVLSLSRFYVMRCHSLQVVHVLTLLLVGLNQEFLVGCLVRLNMQLFGGSPQEVMEILIDLSERALEYCCYFISLSC